MIGSRLRLRTQAPAQLEAIQPRQADVEDRQIRQAGRQRPPRIGAIGERLRPIAFAPQREGDGLADGFLVLHDRHGFRDRLHVPEL